MRTPGGVICACGLQPVLKYRYRPLRKYDINRLINRIPSIVYAAVGTAQVSILSIKIYDLCSYRYSIITLGIGVHIDYYHMAYPLTQAIEFGVSIEPILIVPIGKLLDIDKGVYSGTVQLTSLIRYKFLC